MHLILKCIKSCTGVAKRLTNDLWFGEHRSCSYPHLCLFLNLIFLQPVAHVLVIPVHSDIPIQIP